MARNLKYYPLGLQEALLKEEQLKDALGYEVKRTFQLIKGNFHCSKKTKC